MGEHPILFSAPMVQAILAGRKSQTRRVVKPQPEPIPDDVRKDPKTPANRQFWWPSNRAMSMVEVRDMCGMLSPYGAPGDRLWVREKFQPLFASGFDHNTVDWKTGKGYACRYVATDGIVEWMDGDDHMTDRCMPSIHMPRWASRLTLEVTGVRVERLQDISEADAIAEGSQCAGVPAALTNFAAYAKLWEKINGPGSWALNPWVWVVEFKRVEVARGVR